MVLKDFLKSFAGKPTTKCRVQKRIHKRNLKIIHVKMGWTNWCKNYRRRLLVNTYFSTCEFMVALAMRENRNSEEPLKDKSV